MSCGFTWHLQLGDGRLLADMTAEKTLLPDPSHAESVGWEFYSHHHRLQGDI